MVPSWLRSFFAPKSRTLTNGRRRAKQQSMSFRPRLDSLDDRIAPAIVGTLQVSGNYLIYNGTAASNNVTISGTDASITISDTAGEINSTVPGYKSNNTSSVTLPIPAGVTQILINGQSGFDIITIGDAGLNTTSSVQLVGEMVNVNGDLTTSGVSFQTGTTGLVTLNEVVVSTAATAKGGDVSILGSVILTGAENEIVTDSVTDGNVVFNGTVAGTGNFRINGSGLTGPANSGGNVSFNKSVALDLSLFVGNNADPNNPIPGANNLYLYQGASAAGHLLVANNNVVVGGNLTAVDQPISIIANADAAGSEGFRQTAGNITTGNSSVIIDGQNAVTIWVNGRANGGGTGTATIRGITVGAGGEIQIDTGSTAGGGGIIDGNGVGTLNLDTGATGFVTLIAGGTAGNAGVNLDTQTGDLSARVSDPGATGNIVIRNSGSALNVFRAQTQKGLVTITNDGGDITIDDNGDDYTISATGNVTLTSSDGIVNKAASGGISGDKVTLTANNGGIGAAGDSITVDANSLSLASTDGIFVTTDTNSTKANKVLGATTTTNDIELETTNAAIDLVLGGNVGTSTGNVTLTSARDVDITGGSVTAGLDVTIEAARDVDLSAGRSIISGGGVTIMSPTLASTIAISGNIISTAWIEILGTTGGVQTIAINGSLTTSGVILINMDISSAGSVLNAPGTLSATSGAFVLGSAAGSTIMNVKPSSTPFLFFFSGNGNILHPVTTSTFSVGAGTVDFTNPSLADWAFVGTPTIV